jgi:hypothetical protein
MLYAYRGTGGECRVQTGTGSFGPTVRRSEVSQQRFSASLFSVTLCRDSPLACTFGAYPSPKDACGQWTDVAFLWPRSFQSLATVELRALQHGRVELALTSIMHTARILFRSMTTKRILSHSSILSENGMATLPSKHSTMSWRWSRTMCRVL